MPSMTVGFTQFSCSIEPCLRSVGYTRNETNLFTVDRRNGPNDNWRAMVIRVILRCKYQAFLNTRPNQLANLASFSINKLGYSVLYPTKSWRYAAI